MSLAKKSGAYRIEAIATASATFCLDELYSAPDPRTPVTGFRRVRVDEGRQRLAG